MTEKALSTDQRDWRAGCECARAGLCYRCQAAARIEWLERYSSAQENEIKLANQRLAQCRDEYAACIATVDRLENGAVDATVTTTEKTE